MRMEIRPGVFAVAGGGLFLESHRALIVADLHLGYAWAQRRRGQLGPMGDGGVARALYALLDAYEPAMLVLAGDVVHAPKPAPEERRLIAEILDALASRTQLRIVPGNHDRRFARDFPGVPMEAAGELLLDPFLIVHGDQPRDPGERTLILGHFHPAYALFDDAGAKHRVPAFLVGERAIVLPAFSPFAAGSDMHRHLEPWVKELLGPEVAAFAATAKRVVALGKYRL